VTNPHFAWLPPEINSALLLAGPGSAPLLAAAAAWDGLAEDLSSSASSFFSVTSDLANGSWQGPSSAAMMAVATQYVSWLTAAAAQAEAASSQAAATAAAFETALAATIQPAVVAANRALSQILAATNWFGLNAPAIADTESAYEQMWAADVAAMFGYHSDASLAAQQLAPWQQVMQKLGFNFNTGQPSSRGGTGAPSTQSTPGATAAAQSAATSTQSNSNAGPGNSGSQNVGTGNTGNSNVGFGNQGSGNVGFGNQGSGNFGFGNIGNNDIGFGLTGNNQIGFGTFSSSTGNLGAFGSGGNMGLFNSGVGIGNSGTLSAGLANGASSMGVFPDSGLVAPGSAAALNPGHYVTGGLGAANLSSGLLNSAAMNTGGFNPGIGNAGLLNPGLANAAASAVNPSAMITDGLESSGMNTGVVSASNAPTPHVGSRATASSPTGFATRDSGIPSSNFFSKGDATSGNGEPGLPGLQGLPGLPD
jgi:PPE-repeat protein